MDGDSDLRRGSRSVSAARGALRRDSCRGCSSIGAATFAAGGSGAFISGAFGAGGGGGDGSALGATLGFGVEESPRIEASEAQ